MITVQKYNPERHLELLKDWHKSWSLPEYPWDLLPSHGWIAYDEDKIIHRNRPLAAAFIREAEKQTIMFDHVLSTPARLMHTTGKVGEAVERVFEEVEHYCRVHNVRIILGWSQNARVLDKAREHGFTTYPTTATVRYT